MALALRVVLALVNTDANDNHLAVVEILAFENRVPELEDTFQAYHAKLYHTTVALLWKLSPTDSRYVLIRVAQLLNVAVGVWTLLLVRRWLERFALTEPTRTLLFGLVALNPRLAGLNAQATNDTFLAFLALAALMAAGRYFSAPSPARFGAMLLPATLAPLAKANGFLAVCAIAACFGLQVIHRRAARPLATLGLAAVFLGVTFGAAFAVGPYGKHWRKYGDPWKLNLPTNPRPHWLERTEERRPGARSIVEALGTFRLLDLLRHPQIARPAERPDYELHRTSLWTQLHARAHFAHYDNHPPTWITTNPVLQWIGRTLYILGLPWSALMVVGLARQSFRAARWKEPEAAPAVLAAVAQIVFLMNFCLVYRDFTSMKAIYLLAGLGGFVYALAAEADRRLAGPGGRALWASGLCLGALYVVDAAWLSGHLLADKLPLLAPLLSGGS